MVQLQGFFTMFVGAAKVIRSIALKGVQTDRLGETFPSNDICSCEVKELSSKSQSAQRHDLFHIFTVFFFYVF